MVTNVQSPQRKKAFAVLKLSRNAFYMKTQIHFFTKYFSLQFLKNAPAKKIANPGRP